MTAPSAQLYEPVLNLGQRRRLFWLHERQLELVRNLAGGARENDDLFEAALLEALANRLGEQLQEERFSLLYDERIELHRIGLIREREMRRR